jgi:hypothetical protein
VICIYICICICICICPAHRLKEEQVKRLQQYQADLAALQAELTAKRQQAATAEQLKQQLAAAEARWAAVGRNRGQGGVCDKGMGWVQDAGMWEGKRQLKQRCWQQRLGRGDVKGYDVGGIQAAEAAGAGPVAGVWCACRLCVCREREPLQLMILCPSQQLLPEGAPRPDKDAMYSTAGAPTGSDHHSTVQQRGHTCSDYQ